VTGELRRRRWRVEVLTSAGGGQARVVDVSELDVEFSVTKDLTRQPNKATVKIWNLARERRASLANALANGTGVFVRVHAGYIATGIHQLFVGDVRKLTGERSGTDVVTAIEARDAGAHLRSARIARSFAPGTSAEAVVRAAAAALEVGEGNLATYAPGIRLADETSLREGFVAHGSAARVLDELLRAADLRWTVQDGALQIRPRAQAASERAVVLSPSTGLVGSPRLEERGMVAATALVQPGLDPGLKVSLRSAEVEGGFVVKQVEYQGATRGTSWYAALKLKPY
jgi:hypothetical protein